MTVFHEPSETLCGFAFADKYAVCVKRWPHEGEHQPCPYDEVARSLEITFTPCQWHFPLPGTPV